MRTSGSLLHSSRRVGLAAAVVAALALGLSGCVAPGDDAAPSTAGPTPTASASSTPSATPTSSASPSATPTRTPDPTTPPTPAPATVSVQILNTAYDPASGAIRVAGMVTDLVSSTGMCVATASQGDVSVSAQSAGQADAAVTYCADLAVVLPAGSTGAWDLALGFVDEEHQGVATASVVVG